MEEALALADAAAAEGEIPVGAVVVDREGQIIGRVEEGKLGANVHASIDGKVRTVTAEYVEISA